MNLENFAVQEMNSQELINVDGGGWFDDLVEDAAYAVGVAVGVAVATVTVAAHIVADAIVDH